MEPITAVLACSILLVIFLPYFIPFYIQRRKFWTIDALGGPRWMPIIGTTKDFIGLKSTEMLPELKRRNKEYGPIYRTWTVMEPSINLTKAEQAEIVLRRASPKGDIYKFLKPYLGEGLVTSEGAKWKLHRKLLTPTFHFQLLDKAQAIFSENGQRLADCLVKKVDAKSHDIQDALALCNLDVITESGMGIKVNALEGGDSNFVNSVRGFSKTAAGRIYKGHHHLDFIFNRSEEGKLQQKYLDYLLRFNNKIINDRKEERKNHKREEVSEEDQLLGKKKQYIFLDLVLEQMELQDSVLTDQDLRDEVNTFIGAAHDTTTAALNWTVLAVASYPEIQAKVHIELDEVFQGEERPITPQDLNKLEYLERVIKEVHRYVTVVPLIGRKLEEDVMIDGHTIPGGVLVLVHMHAIHRDPQYWDRPDTFDPDRFLPENSAHRHPYAFIPFAAGPRNCIGQKFATKNSKTILAHIFRKFNVKTEKKIHETGAILGVATSPEGGVNVSLELRQAHN